MSLMHAYRLLLESGRAAGGDLELSPPGGALVRLLEVADEHGLLETSHPWELAPRVCRELEDVTGFAPAGGWARLAGLAAGAGVLHATPDGFQPLATRGWVESFDDGFRRRMVEGFTTKLIPPAAAAALYVALDVHPVWGLRLGRDVGACDLPPVGDPDVRGMQAVRLIVFGTLSGLLGALRDLAPQREYPVDGLGEVLWSSAVAARLHASAAVAASDGLPIFVDAVADERRMLTTRMAVVDLLDYVFVPAGVARRADSGWFAVDPIALTDVTVGDLAPEGQEEMFAALCNVDGEAA